MVPGHQYGISVVPLTSFRVETRFGVAKCRLFSQVIFLAILTLTEARSGLVHVTEDSFVSLVKHLNNKNEVCKPWCLLLLFDALSLLSQSWFRELPNDNGNGNENAKKAKGLYKQNNNSVSLSHFMVLFFATL